MSNDSRSHSGCWTCRARRKKCDESSHTCRTCVSLQLTCYGYGAKPEWIDGGAKEKAQVEEFKRTVKRGTKCRRRSRLGKQNQSQRSSLSSLDIDESIRNDSNSRNNESMHSDDFASLNPVSLDLRATYTIGVNTPLTAENAIDWGNQNSSNDVDNINFNWDNFLMEPSSDGKCSGSLMDPQASTGLVSVDDPTFQNTSSISICRLPFNNLRVRSTALSPDIESSSSSSRLSSPSKLAAIGVSQLEEYFPSLCLQELAAITYYIERMFPLQFPYLETTKDNTVCHQMLRLASTSRICTSSILSQGIYAQQSALHRVGLNGLSNLKESIASYDAESLEQLKHYLLFVATDNDTDTNAAMRVCTLLDATQIMISKIARKDNSWPNTIGLLASHEPIDFRKDAYDSFRSLSVFQNALYCLDILCSTCTHEEPKFAFKFKKSLWDECTAVHFDEVTGCENAALDCILSITMLYSWKHKEGSKGTISVLQLARRAFDLQIELDKIREKCIARINNPAVTAQSRRNNWVITNVFACAASVYLYTTVSGPQPGIAETKQAVGETIEAIKLISDVSLLKSSAWPVCIAASLADVEHQDFFQKLGIGVLEEYGRGHSIVRAVDVARECWRLRKSSSSTIKQVDWTDAMVSSGDISPFLF